MGGERERIATTRGLAGGDQRTLSRRKPSEHFRGKPPTSQESRVTPQHKGKVWLLYVVGKGAGRFADLVHLVCAAQGTEEPGTVN